MRSTLTKNRYLNISHRTRKFTRSNLKRDSNGTDFTLSQWSNGSLPTTEQYSINYAKCFPLSETKSFRLCRNRMILNFSRSTFSVGSMKAFHASWNTANASSWTPKFKNTSNKPTLLISVINDNAIF